MSRELGGAGWGASGGMGYGALQTPPCRRPGRWRAQVPGTRVALDRCHGHGSAGQAQHGRHCPRAPKISIRSARDPAAPAPGPSASSLPAAGTGPARRRGRRRRPEGEGAAETCPAERAVWGGPPLLSRTHQGVGDAWANPKSEEMRSFVTIAALGSGKAQSCPQITRGQPGTRSRQMAGTGASVRAHADREGEHRRPRPEAPGRGTCPSLLCGRSPGGGCRASVPPGPSCPWGHRVKAATHRPPGTLAGPRGPPIDRSLFPGPHRHWSVRHPWTSPGLWGKELPGSASENKTQQHRNANRAAAPSSKTEEQVAWAGRAWSVGWSRRWRAIQNTAVLLAQDPRPRLAAGLAIPTPPAANPLGDRSRQMLRPWEGRAAWEPCLQPPHRSAMLQATAPQASAGPGSSGRGLPARLLPCPVSHSGQRLPVCVGSGDPVCSRHTVEVQPRRLPAPACSPRHVLRPSCRVDAPSHPPEKPTGERVSEAS